MGKEGLLGRTYKDGDIIVREGTESMEMYVIQSGKVTVVKGSGTTETVLAILSEGDIFGEMSFIDARPRSATVKAIGKARALAVDHEMFLKLVRMDNTFVFKVLNQMGQRIRILNKKISNAITNKMAITSDELIELKEYLEDRPLLC